MRGEHPINCISCGSGIGSSPHARGTRLFDRHAHVILRFIPACAGNTRHHQHYVVRAPVHPRMRGEHRMSHAKSISSRGSSPHARGTRRIASAAADRPRFIPACAGNTVYAARIRSFLPVHPRMRGEHATTGGRIKETCGSSPHARGTPQFNAVHARHQRFIPACAGNTVCPTMSCVIVTVHPRMRGEHALSTAKRIDQSGSSPHARGTLLSTGRA